MTVDVFIRTYHKDIPWLEHALRSIHKHVTGYRRIIVTIPQGQGELLAHLTAETVIEVLDLKDGYMGQQLTKMEAWRYTDADAVLFWDSDTVATEPVDIATEYLRDGKPLIYMTPYDQVGAAKMWQQPTEITAGWWLGFEYMRRLPLLYRTDTLKACCEYIEQKKGVDLSVYIDNLERFSEFNVIGAYADREEGSRYAFVNTDDEMPPPNKVRQFWSWGGITPEVQAQLDAL